MALFDPNKRRGPRAVHEWIGDAYVVDAWSARRSFYDRPRAIWAGDGGPALARARRGSCAPHEERAAFQASIARGDGLVATFATYLQADELFIVERDDADLTLRDLMNALAHERDALPFGLVGHVMRAFISAFAAAPVALDPRCIDVAWDGRVLFRPAHPSELVEGEDDDAFDVLRLAYRADRPWRTLACVLHELITGTHPFGSTAVTYDPAAYDTMRERMERATDAYDALPAHMDVPAAVATFIERHLQRRAGDALLCAPFGDDAPGVEPFSAADLEAMLRGLFADKRRACELEREERLMLTPTPRVRREAWALFSQA